MKQTARLTQWQVGYGQMLYGIVYDHPRIADGLPIHTSRIVKLDRENKVCETLNTIYTLEEELKNA